MKPVILVPDDNDQWTAWIGDVKVGTKPTYAEAMVLIDNELAKRERLNKPLDLRCAVCTPYLFRQPARKVCHYCARPACPNHIWGAACADCLDLAQSLRTVKDDPEWIAENRVRLWEHMTRLKANDQWYGLVYDDAGEIEHLITSEGIPAQL